MTEMDTPTLYGIIHWYKEGKATMPWVRSGFGDGNYPIYELLAGNRRVGIEISFINAEPKADQVCIHAV